MANVLPGQYYDTIQCRLQEVSLKDNSARFLALSYCWNTSKTEETVTVDGQPVRITTNLHAALRNARAPSTAVSLWVDQICVDQTNIIDRNDQVGKMGAIFRAASGVIVWLGEADDGVASAMDLPKKIRRYWPSLYDNPSLLTHHSQTPAEVPKWGERAWRAFQALLLRPWFKRLWVIQEIACARDIVVTCRSNTALWKDFVKLIYVVDAMHHSSLGVNHMLGSKSAAQYVGFMEELRSVTEQGTKQAAKDYASEDSMAPYVLRMAKDCNATDHRDKLYAFHHIIRLVTRPDYAVDIETLYQQFAVQYLQRIAYAISEFDCDAVALSKRQLGFIYSAGLCNQHLELPSWCPDWSVPWHARPLWLDSKCYQAGGSEVKEIMPIAESALHADTGFRLPLVAKVFDRVLAAGAVGLRFSKQNLAETLREWLFPPCRCCTLTAVGRTFTLINTWLLHVLSLQIKIVVRHCTAKMQ